MNPSEHRRVSERAYSPGIDRSTRREDRTDFDVLLSILSILNVETELLFLFGFLQPQSVPG
jgi:hypothetical protein